MTQRLVMPGWEGMVIRVPFEVKCHQVGRGVVGIPGMMRLAAFIAPVG